MQISTAVLVAALIAAAASPPSDPVGIWKTPVDDGLIKIERCGADICGRPFSSAHLRSVPDQKDVLNKDPNLRGRFIKNLLIFRLQPVGPGKWGQGTIYNPKDGGTYSAELTMPNANQVRLKGCLVAPFCKTQSWNRSQ